MFLLSLFAAVGLDTLLIGELATMDRARARHMLTTSLVVVTVTSVVLGAGWMIACNFFGPALHALTGSVVLMALAVLGLVLTAITVVLNAAVISIGRSWLQVLVSATASGTKLLAVPATVWLGHLARGRLTASELLAGWVGGLAVSLLVCVPLALRGAKGARRGPDERPARLVKRYKMLALQHFFLNLSLNGSTLLLPFVASAVLVPAAVAYYATARLIASALLTVPYLLTLALFAVVASDTDALRRRVRQTVCLGLVINIVIIAVIAVSAHFVLEVFGSHYADQGASVLRTLVVAGLPLVVIDHFIAVNRIHRRLASSAYWIAGGTVLQLLGGLIGGLSAGLEGMCLGWVAALVCEAAVLSPTVYRAAVHKGAVHKGAGPGPAVSLPEQVLDLEAQARETA
jgi:O-antigen/teichoic acid export membrane protein